MNKRDLTGRSSIPGVVASAAVVGNLGMTSMEVGQAVLHLRVFHHHLDMVDINRKLMALKGLLAVQLKVSGTLHLVSDQPYLLALPI